MGTLAGKQSVNLYIDPEVYRVICMMAADRGEKNYVVVEEALRLKIERDLSPEQQKVFRYEKEKTSATAQATRPTNGASAGGAQAARSKAPSGRRSAKREGRDPRR